ncbi:aminotransferase class-III, putative glutamate-1-semialdehyde aminotransferase [Crocosphaera subtropica ATCC 51142]|uniref:Aminotransferase class-III, putative glutamate-1-semialdehyde aminotransferase n=1 Tax=Crocosphaera subtropica (strain ATCC 51142 / BH68) TaxID=43989 RepID=B1WWS4_CROS5|nr:aspartate aminotransferase family protein [Crocosphaera subtropica]ACB52393.1 aminotransferase class-III, putative glutamate-1-semialdehyde aminotransferase [Crocosphaera subtropica ATCC 51142]
MQVSSKNKSEIQAQALKNLIESHTQKTAKSKQLAQQNRPILADRSALGIKFSPNLKEICYPIIIERSKGPKIWDIDGNEYVDILMGLGINLFGHNPDFIKKAIAQQLEQGIQVGSQTTLAAEVAQLVKDLTGVERVALSNTGTEAIMAAIRIARSVTKRPKIALFTNSYHGHSDQTLVRATLAEYAKKAINRKIVEKTANNNWLNKLTRPLQSQLQNNLNPKAVPAALGIPPSLAKDVLVLEYGNDRSLDIIKAYRQQLAAILVEPVQSRCPELQPQAFLKTLRQVTQEADIALIFDEMVTGFRIHQGGAQAWFGVEADIVTYSKIAGGGLPLSIIAGKAAYLDRIDGGMWQFGDDSSPLVEPTFFAGTYCKHPLSLAAAKATLDHLKTEGLSLQDGLNRKTAKFVTILNSELKARDRPIQFTYFGSFFALDLSQSVISPLALNLLSYYLLRRGVHLRQGDRGGFLSTAHTEDDIKFIIQGFLDSINDLQMGGFLG